MYASLYLFFSYHIDVTWFLMIISVFLVWFESKTFRLLLLLLKSVLREGCQSASNHTLLFFLLSPYLTTSLAPTAYWTTSLSSLKKTNTAENMRDASLNDANSRRQSTTADRKPRYGADRGDLFKVRRTPGTRVQRRAETYEKALLHQFCLHKLPSGGGGEEVYVK